jgi:hypothetical protein
MRLYLDFYAKSATEKAKNISIIKQDQNEGNTVLFGVCLICEFAFLLLTTVPH